MKMVAGSKSQSIYIELPGFRKKKLRLAYIRNRCKPVFHDLHVMDECDCEYEPYGICSVDNEELFRVDIPDEAVEEGTDKVQIVIYYDACYNRQEIDLAPVQIDLSQKYDESEVGVGLTVGAVLSLVRAVAVNRSEVVGTTLRIYQNDGKTILAEFKLDSALDPTVRVPINESD